MCEVWVALFYRFLRPGHHRSTSDICRLHSVSILFPFSAPGTPFLSSFPSFPRLPLFSCSPARDWTPGRIGALPLSSQPWCPSVCKETCDHRKWVLHLWPLGKLLSFRDSFFLSLLSSVTGSHRYWRLAQTSSYIAKVDLELPIFLSPPPQCWNERFAPPGPVLCCTRDLFQSFMNARQILYPYSLIPHPTQGPKGSQLPQTARINQEQSSCPELREMRLATWERWLSKDTRDALSPLLWPINTVPHTAVTPNHKIFCHYFIIVLLLLVWIIVYICDMQDTWPGATGWEPLLEGESWYLLAADVMSFVQTVCT